MAVGFRRVVIASVIPVFDVFRPSPILIFFFTHKSIGLGVFSRLFRLFLHLFLLTIIPRLSINRFLPLAFSILSFPLSRAPGYNVILDECVKAHLLVSMS